MHVPWVSFDYRLAVSNLEFKLLPKLELSLIKLTVIRGQPTNSVYDGPGIKDENVTTKYFLDQVE